MDWTGAEQGGRRRSSPVYLAAAAAELAAAWPAFARLAARGEGEP